MNIPQKAHKVNQQALARWSGLKFGLFIHWGIYSVPAGIWKGKKIPRLGEQIQRHAAISRDEYAALAGKFDPIGFDARQIASLAVEAGMKYIVLTAKHHDGFCMFKSETTPFNIVDATPFGRDILKELSEACRESGLKLGVYFSNPDWHYQAAVTRSPENKYAVFEEYTEEHLELSKRQLTELLTNYGEICEVFFDMGLPSLEDSIALTSLVHGLQPDCLVSGRVMNNQGDFLTLPDNHLPENPIEEGWETPCTFYHTWGYKSWIERPPADEQYHKQIRLISRVTSSGGNYLLNIGPLADGSVHPYEKDMLARIGKWMARYGTSIHGTDKSPFRARHSWGYASQKDRELFLHVHGLPPEGSINVNGIKEKPLSVRMLHNGEEVPWKRTDRSLILEIARVPVDTPVPIIVCLFAEAPTVLPPHAVQKGDAVALPQEVETSQGNYNGLQYNTNVPHTGKQWDFIVNEPGRYSVTVDYALAGKPMPLKLDCLDESLRFTLEGDDFSRGEGFSDGNEIDSRVEALTGRSCSVGVMNFYRSGNHVLSVSKDSSRIDDNGIWTVDQIKDNPHRGLWCLNETWTAHRAAMAKESMEGLTIKSLKLRRLR